MSGKAWTPKEMKELEKAYKNKPEWTTDMELARLLSSQFNRSVESVRWQMRQYHRESNAVQAPKILLLDIETSPIQALVWGTYKQDINMVQIQKDWSILCWSAKWLYDSKVMGQVVLSQEAIEHRDNSVLMGIWELMNEADIIITHYGDQFDIKKLYARFFQMGYPKPMYFKSIDTKKVASDTFGFTYSKLDWIAQILGVGRKIETDFTWWAECVQGNPKYLKMMLEYNKWDVNLEEEVYLKLRPWIEKHPNLGLYGASQSACPACGSLNLHWKGTYSTALGLYQAFRCEDCGALGRSTKKQYKLNATDTSN